MLEGAKNHHHKPKPGKIYPSFKEKEILPIDVETEIRQKYIYGVIIKGRTFFPTIADLAEEYEININILKNLANKGQWTKVRKLGQETLTKQEIHDDLKKLLIVGTSLETKNLELLSTIYNVLEKTITRIDDILDNNEELNQREIADFIKSAESSVRVLTSLINLKKQITPDDKLLTTIDAKFEEIHNKPESKEQLESLALLMKDYQEDLKYLNN